MGVDEEATVATLNDCRAIFKTRIAEHHGRVVDTAGDSVLAEFPSVVEAVRTAIEVQDALARLNEVLLQITSHLANGAKHLVAEASHHESVLRTRRQYGLFGRFFGHPLDRLVAPGLLVVLDGAAEAAYGPSISASVLARLVLDYWVNQPL